MVGIVLCDRCGEKYDASKDFKGSCIGGAERNKYANNYKTQQVLKLWKM